MYFKNDIYKDRYNFTYAYSLIKFRASKSYVSQRCDNRAVLMSKGVASRTDKG